MGFHPSRPGLGPRQLLTVPGWGAQHVAKLEARTVLLPGLCRGGCGGLPLLFFPDGDSSSSFFSPMWQAGEAALILGLPLVVGRPHN